MPVTRKFYPSFDAGMCQTECPYRDENVGSINCQKCQHNHKTIKRDDNTMERDFPEVIFCKHPQAQEA